MLHVQLTDEPERDLISQNCRVAAEQALHTLIAVGEKHGLRPAELAMALADAADDYILLLAHKQTSRH